MYVSSNHRQIEIEDELTIERISPDSSDTSKNIVTILLDNVPDASAAGELIVNVGGYDAQLRRVAFASRSRILIEVITPRDISDAGKVTILVASQAATSTWSSTSDFNFIDPRYVLTNLESEPLIFPSSGAQPVRVSVSNLPVTVAGAADEVSVSFAGVSAQAFSIESIVGNLMTLRITPPVYTLSGTDDGFAAAYMTVSLRSNAAMFAETRVEFYSAPTFSAEFDGKGTSVILTFDQDTDRASMGVSTSDCTLMLSLTVISSLGTEPKCIWKTDSEASIVLGRGAIIVPGDSVSIKSVRSRNKVSQPSSASAVIAASPDTPVPLLKVRAPAEVDPCSPLELLGVAESPRTLIYTWRCLDDETLNAALELVPGDTVTLAAGTPEMPGIDRSYTITVRVTDFMGIQSEEVAVMVYKKSTAGPSIIFSPSSLSTFTSEPVLIRAEAVYSSCPVAKEAMVFSWSQLSGPSAVDTKYLLPQAQLAIPKHVLKSSSSYEFQVQVSMLSDPSIQSLGTFTVLVKSLPLSARISGPTDVSNLADFALDGSKSKDLDLDDSLPDQGLEFSWRCTLLNDGHTDVCRTEKGTELALAQTATLTVAAGTLLPTSIHPYIFTMTVSKVAKAPSSFSVSVTVLNRYVPQVTMSVTSDHRIKADGSTQINAGDKLVMTAHPGQDASSITWSISPAVDMSDASVFPLGWNQDSFVIKEGAAVLIPGVMYSILLKCTASDSSATSRLDLEVNTVPQGGICQSCLAAEGDGCLKTGAAIIDRFVISCSRFADDDTPLRYEFGYKVNDGPEIWFDRTSLPSNELRLPSGTIQTLARVVDSAGGATAVLTDMLSVGTSQRRQAGVDFTAALDLVTAEVQTQDASGVNQLTTTIAVEVSRAAPADAPVVIQSLMQQLSAAQQFAVVNREYLCECLQAIHKVSETLAIQTQSSLQDATRLIGVLNTGLTKQGEGEPLNQECSSFAVDIAATALKYQQTHGTDFGKTFMSDMSAGMEATIARLAGSLAQDEELHLSSRTATTSHTLQRKSAADLSANDLSVTSSSSRRSSESAVAVRTSTKWVC